MSEEREQKLKEDAYQLFEFIRRGKTENLSDAEMSLFNQLVKYFHIPETNEFIQLTPEKQQEAKDRMVFLRGLSQYQLFEELKKQAKKQAEQH